MTRLVAGQRAHERKRKQTELARAAAAEAEEAAAEREEAMDGLVRANDFSQGAVLVVAIGLFVALAGTREVQLRTLIATVVSIGAIGLFARGVGELRPSHRAKWWKFWGYIAGGSAYAITAVVAFSNGLAEMLNR